MLRRVPRWRLTCAIDCWITSTRHFGGSRLIERRSSARCSLHIPRIRSRRDWSFSTFSDRVCSLCPSLRIIPHSVDVYLPADVFYDSYTYETITSSGKYRETKSPVTHIPLFIRGGQIIPVMVKSGMTTTEVREQEFELVVAMGRDGGGWRGVCVWTTGRVLSRRGREHRTCALSSGMGH